MREGTDLFEIIASHTKIKSNKDGEKGRESIHPQGLLPQIQELTWKMLAQVIRLELKASLSLLLMTWTLHAGSVKGRKENYITICTNTQINEFKFKFLVLKEETVAHILQHIRTNLCFQHVTWRKTGKFFQSFLYQSHVQHGKYGLTVNAQNQELTPALTTAPVLGFPHLFLLWHLIL